MDTADYISVMLQRENVIGPRPDRTTVTLIREIYKFSIKKVHDQMQKNRDYKVRHEGQKTIAKNR